ncbi:hypothetical protein, partial [Asticcacaulis benevestitus]|uniref:hypothetical protein n=1 Tax=Asticcacaulis benevestitus TaxID=347481 RepID=UPI000AF2B525
MTTNNASNYHRINHQSTSESISGVQVLQQANKQKSPTPSTHTEDAVRHSGKGTTAPKPSTANTREGRHADWAAELIEKHQNAVANLRAAIAPFNPVGAPLPSPLEEKEAEKAHWLELA